MQRLGQVSPRALKICASAYIIWYGGLIFSLGEDCRIVLVEKMSDSTGSSLFPGTETQPLRSCCSWGLPCVRRISFSPGSQEPAGCLGYTGTIFERILWHTPYVMDIRLYFLSSWIFSITMKQRSFSDPWCILLRLFVIQVNHDLWVTNNHISIFWIMFSGKIVFWVNKQSRSVLYSPKALTV